MTPLEADIAWHRQKVEETLTAIARVELEPESPSREAELRILTDAVGVYIMTASKLEAMLPSSLKTMELACERRDSLQTQIDALFAAGPLQSSDLERLFRLRQDLRQTERLIAALNALPAALPSVEA